MLFQNSLSPPEQKDPPNWYFHKFTTRNLFWLFDFTGHRDFFFSALILFIKDVFLGMVMSRLAFYCGHLPWSSAWAPPWQKIPRDNVLMLCIITWLLWIYRARCVWHRGTDLVPTLCQQHLWWRMERGSSTHGWGMFSCSETPACIRSHHLEKI